MTFRVILKNNNNTNSLTDVSDAVCALWFANERKISFSSSHEWIIYLIAICCHWSSGWAVKYLRRSKVVIF